jgi:hypothetical protein
VPFYRYVVMANMLYKKFNSRRWELRYWWPIRRCRQELLAARSGTPK